MIDEKCRELRFIRLEQLLLGWNLRKLNFKFKLR